MSVCLLILTLCVPCISAYAIDFPGQAPGRALSAQKNGTYTLSNSLLSLSWRAEKGQFRLSGVTNRLNGQKTLSGAQEVFQLSTAAAPDSKVQDGFYLGWRLDEKQVTALYGDGKSWRTLKTFPRSRFPGLPLLLRAGKLSMQADAADYDDPGKPGSARIEDIKPKSLGTPALLPSGRGEARLAYTNGTLKINSAANTTAFAEWPLKDAPSLLSARFWKDSDSGQSWGPGIALIWPNGKFALLNARSPLGQFSIATREGETLVENIPPVPNVYDLPASAFRLVGAPQLKSSNGQKELIAQFRHPSKPVSVEWRAVLRDGSHYVRQLMTVKSSADAGTLSGVELINFPVAGAEQIGTVPGSPVAGNNWFFGLELPVSTNDVTSNVRSFIACSLPLTADQSYRFGSVAGVYPNGQMRRSLLAYVERERARPTKPFLHYNCWYDLAQRVNEKDLTAAITAFHNEMTVKRGVQIDSYVVDDGWDDARNTFWGVDARKFPSGFAPVADDLKRYGSHLGLWISPLGGYGEAGSRTDNARKQGIVESGKGLDLSYTPYYNWWLEEHLKLMRDYQVNYFKWDRAGEGVNPHFMALVRAANELRRADPNLFINVTVGTWPSPFWLNHIDSTWRAGADIAFTGPGNKREQWLNYRDGELYNRVVKPAPLYPLNSIMHHGIAYGQYYQGKDIAPAGPDLKHDARSYFATGATLQELYLTPSMMTQDGWDEVAKGAKWSHENADVLVDSHWIGGDPGKGEVYGYASWSPRKGIFMLRNPSDKGGSITLDADKIFELPRNSKRRFKLSSPYTDQRVKSGELRAGAGTTFTLEPLEVLVFEAIPN